VGGAGEIKRVLFVCYGNTCRSPMAAAIARQFLGPAVEIQSAGIMAHDGAPATPEAIDVLGERGLDLSGHRARRVDGVDRQAFDLVVAIDASVAAALRSRGLDPVKIVELDIRDPIRQGTDAYGETADRIAHELERIFGSGRQSQ
jgi:protein-tyrosine-phosphatase